MCLQVTHLSGFHFLVHFVKLQQHILDELVPVDKALFCDVYFVEELLVAAAENTLPYTGAALVLATASNFMTSYFYRYPEAHF